MEDEGAKVRPSPLGLAVLSLLVAGPLHPYGMQRLIRLWGKDQVINVGQRANLYKTIARMKEGGLVTIRHSERSLQYPERTVYQLTDEGRAAVRDWLTEMLAAPRREFPQFPAALSFAMLLTPQAAEAALARRADVLRGRLAELEEDLPRLSARLPRVVLLDDEYRRAMTAAELTWITGLIGELRSGELTWSEDQLIDLASADLGGGDRELVE
jgi:DNA-binding PadR family transcriptional regulator